MASITAFFFDIGNVLVGFDFEPALDRLQASCKHPVALGRADIESLKNEYESGRIGRAEFLHRARQILGYRGEEAEFVAIWQEIFVPNPPMHDLVRTLAPRYPLYHLSNTSDLHMEYLRREYPVFNRFQGGTYSYLVGAMKPEPEIYRSAIAAHGVDPACTVFVDDLPANVDAAVGFGFRAFRYRMDRHGDFLAWLEEFGVVGLRGGAA